LFSLNYSLIIASTALTLIIFFALYFWKRAAGGFRPIIVGAASFFVFAILSESILYIFLSTFAEDAVKKIIEHRILYVAFGCSMAGIFEETGRYYAFKQVMPEFKEPASALGYGIGHGGLELFLSGVVGLLMSAPAGFGAKMSLLWIGERIIALSGHIALSVIVFAGARTHRKYLFPAAVLLHAIADIPIGLYKFGSISLPVCDLIFAGFVLLCCFFAKLFWERLEREKH
jgi:uncharacterized membrane protein YhfC